MPPDRDDPVWPIWVLVGLVVIVLVVRELLTPTQRLIDVPNERSHPQWKSSSSVCQKSDHTATIRV